MRYVIQTIRCFDAWRHDVHYEAKPDSGIAGAFISRHDTQREANAAIARYMKADKRRREELERQTVAAYVSEGLGE